QRVARSKDAIDIAVPGLGKREAVNGVVDDASAARAVGITRNDAGDGGITNNGGVGQGAATTQGLLTPREIVLVDVVGPEPRPEAVDVDLQALRGPKLHFCVEGLALPFLLEERRADEVRDQQPPGYGLRTVAEDLDPIATDVAFVEDAGEENAEVLRRVLPAVKKRHVRIVLTGLLRVGVLHRSTEGEGFQVEWLTGSHVDRATDSPFIELRGRTLVDGEQAYEFRGQQEVVEAAGGSQLLENEPV